MAKKDRLLAGLEKAYAEARAEEQEVLHNAIVAVIQEHKCSLENALLVLDLIRFALMEAKYKEIMGFVKLTEEPPLATAKKK